MVYVSLYARVETHTVETHIVDTHIVDTHTVESDVGVKAW